jgi:nicotinamidase-related amidase
MLQGNLSESGSEAMAGFRASELASVGASCLVLIDMQEKLLPVISGSERLSGRCQFLLSSAGLFSVPVFLTEQYPRGLGQTTEGLRAAVPGAVVLEKLRFSAADVLRGVLAGLPGLRQVVLAGIETHICVLQTALDLRAAGLQVIVAADATGSRRDADAAMGLSRMGASGVTLATSESVAFEWCESAEHAAFRQLSGLVRSQQ